MKLPSLLLSILLLILVFAPARAQSPALCLLTGNISEIWGLAAGTTGADVRVTYQGITGPQNPVGAGGSIVPGGSRCSIYTDNNGNLPQTGSCTSFLQGAILYVTIGDGQQTRIQIPFNSTADLSTLILANTDPPGLISSIVIAAGGSYILSVTNPAPGTVGQAVLSPGNVTAFQPTTCSSPSILVGEGNGNAVQCTGPNASGYVQAAIAQPTSTASTAQAYLQVQNDNGGFTFLGVRGHTFSGVGPIPSPDASFLEGSGTNGLYIDSDNGAINLSANGQGVNGRLALTEDGSGNFTGTLVNSAQINFNNGNPAAAMHFGVSNTSTGAGAQAGFFVANNSGTVGGIAAIGPNANFGSPYVNGGTYLNSDVGPLIIYSGNSSINFAANGQGAAGSDVLTEDGSGNFNWTSNGANTFDNGQVPVLQAVSTNNNSTDIFRVFPQNLTVGVGLWFGGMRSIGSNGNNNLSIDTQSGGVLNLLQNSGSRVDFYNNMITRNNHHIGTYYDGTSPSISSCTNGSVVAGSTDQQGTVTFSAGGANTCLINFVVGWAAAPTCICNTLQASNTQTTPCEANTSTSQLNMVSTGAITNNSGVYRWICMGQNA